MKMMMRRNGAARNQRGAVTLIITMLILVAVALGIYSQVGTTSIESRMGANDKRGRQAMQAAQAGIDYLLAGLQGGTLDRTYLCAATTKAAHNFVLDFGLTPCNEIPFEIITKLDRVRSWGYSPDGDAVKVIESTIDMTANWNWGMSAASMPGGGGGAAVIARRTAQLGGNADAANCNLQGGSNLCSTIGSSNGNQPGDVNGIVVRAGEQITTQGKASQQLDGFTAQNDASLAALSTEDLFKQFAGNGLSKSEFQQKAFNYTSTSGSGLNQANSGENQLIYVTGDLELKGNVQIGTFSKPVILVVSGNLKVTGTADIWGLVYTGSADFSKGNTKILGGLVSEGSVDMTGTAAVYYNSGLRPDPTTIDPATLLANQTGKTTTVRVGSWREVTLSATAAP